MRSSLRIGSVLLCLAFASVACGDDAGDGSGGGDTTSATGSPTTGTEAGSTGTGDSGSTGAGGEEPECDFPDQVETPPQVREFATFNGTVVTTDGDPVVDDAVQVCGINICLYGNTDAEGVVRNEDGGVGIPQGEVPLNVPIFKVGDGLERAKVGYSFPAAGDDVSIDGTTIALADSGTTLEGGATAEADGVILSIPAEGLVGLNILEFGDPGQDTFRAAVVPADFIDVLAPGQDLIALAGLGPNETIFCPVAGLAIPNDTDLEAGTEVEFVQQSLETGQFFGAYGQWERVAVGRVSEDGATFETDAGEGIPILSTIGVRPL